MNIRRGGILYPMAIVCALSLAFPGVGMSESRVSPLGTGESSSFRIQGVERFDIVIESPARLVIQPRVWTGTSPNTIQLRAVLLNEAGSKVAEGRSRGGLFHLDSRLAPGRYTLVVSGRHLGGPVESLAHYRLQARQEL
jgi:hypothetical protein